ncbi:MAG: hypothetical protein ACK5ST_01180 [bacterium]
MKQSENEEQCISKESNVSFKFFSSVVLLLLPFTNSDTIAWDYHQ